MDRYSPAHGQQFVVVEHPDPRRPGTGQAFIDYATVTVPAALQAIAAAISQGDILGAATELNDVIGSILLVGFPLFDALAIPGQISDNLTNVVHAVAGLQTLLPLVAGVLGPVQGAVSVAGIAGQAFVDAAGSGDPVEAVSSLLNAPAAITDAFINGYETSDGQTTFPGLLSINPQIPAGAGIVQSLLVTLPQAIATALGATPPYTTETASLTAAPAEVDSVPTASTSTVTLTTPPSAQSSIEVVKPAVQPDSQPPAVAENHAGTAKTDESKVDAGIVAASDSIDAAGAIKDGNKAVPGEVATGVDAGTSTRTPTTTTPERTKSPLKALRNNVKSALGKLGLKKPAHAKVNDNGSSSAGADNASSASGGGDE